MLLGSIENTVNLKDRIHKNVLFTFHKIIIRIFNCLVFFSEFIFTCSNSECFFPQESEILQNKSIHEADSISNNPEWDA